MKKSNETLLQAIAVVCEMTGTKFSEAAVRVMVSDLSRYPEAQVLGALDSCRKELRGRLTLADVISRLDDGRPSPEEAWAMMPRTEAESIVWTGEMATAFFVASPLMVAGDEIAARMAFLEVYRRRLQQARDDGAPPRWTPSLGTDASCRESVLLDAAERGRLSAQHVAALLPYRTEPPPRLLALLNRAA